MPSLLLRRLLISLALLAALLGVLYAATPWLVARLAPLLAAPLGLDALQLRIARPGLRSVTVHSVDLVRGRLRIHAAAGRLDFDPAGLLAGRLRHLELAELAVTVAAEETADPVAATSGHLPAADPAALFAALPLATATVAELRLAVPALAFAADGSVRLDAMHLEIGLRGRAPARAAGFALEARLARDGRLRLRLAEADSPGPPLLAVTSELAGDRLALEGEADLDGFVLDLAAELAGLPAGEGSLTGQFAGSLPWPLPDAINWSTAAAEGTLALVWQPDGAVWGIRQSDAGWRLDGGDLHGDLQASLAYAGQSLPLAATLQRLALTEAVGAGSLRLGGTAAGAGGARLDWTLTPAELRLQGDLNLQGDLLALAQAELGVPAGAAALQVTGSTRLPWPLPDRAALAPRAEGTLGGRWRTPDGAVSVTDLDGTWRLDGRRLSGDWRARVGYRGLAADVGLTLVRLEPRDGAVSAAGKLRPGELAPLAFAATQRLDGGAGSLTLNGELTVSRPLAGGLLSGWAQPFDVTAGSVRVGADLHWRQPGIPDGAVRLGLDGVAAFYDDYALSGLDADLALSGRDGAWSLAPAPVRIGRVATGVPLQQVQTGLAWSGDRVRVQASSAQLLGGSAGVEPFEYAIDSGAARFTVALTGLSLAEVLALEGQQVTGTGTLNGSIPVRLDGNAASVVGGQVRAEPPGGVIRVSSDLAGGTGQPGLDFALRALQNFTYQVLEADVEYSAAGDLSLAVHLQGRNPDIEKGRPIHYNLNVTENVPVLLESLRLERQVTEGIERRLNN